MQPARLLLLALPLSACVGVGFPDQAPVTPQRPTLSSDTATTAAGTAEIESGVALDPGDAFSFPTMLKWGTSERTELLAGFSPWSWQNGPGSKDPEGPTDLQLGIRHRFLEQDGNRPSGAVQVTAKLPTANREIGTGETDVFVAAIATRTVEEVSVTGFYQLGVLGNPAGRGSDLEHDLALAGSVSVLPRWSVFGELAGIFVPDQDLDSVFLTTGAMFTYAPSLVFDVGLVVGLSEEAPDLQLVAGFTHNFGGFVRTAHDAARP